MVIDSFKTLTACLICKAFLTDLSGNIHLLPMMSSALIGGVAGQINNSSPSFRYNGLPPRTSHDELWIRVVDLLPGRDSGPIRCNIRVIRSTADTDRCLYEALSYCWGDNTTKETITCSGKYLLITSNLKAALYNLRVHDQTRTLWIDAICIDQGNVDERSDQVRNMHFIFGRAYRVVIWLGEAGDDSSRAFIFIAKLVEEDHYHTKLRARYLTGRIHAVLLKRLKLYLVPTELQQDTGALYLLLRRPWFQRMWVIQEVVIAKMAIVMCGSDQLPWNQFLLGLLRGRLIKGMLQQP